MKIDVAGLEKYVGDYFLSKKVRTPEGVLNYVIKDAKERLYSFVATSTLNKDKFYMSNNEVMEQIKRNIAAVILLDGNYEMNVIWLCKLAVFARHKLYMRTIGLVIITELLRWISDCKHIEDAIYHVVNRPDEIVKLVTMYVDGDKDKSLDNILKRGLARTYFKFDAYQFSKYKNTVCPVTGFTISKLMAMVHPKDSKLGVVNTLLKQVRHNTLPEAYTWEVELSKAGIESDRSDFVEEWFINNVYEHYAIPKDMWNFSVRQAKKFLRECRLGNVECYETYEGNILKDFRKALADYTNGLGVRKTKMEELIDSGRLPYQAALMNLRLFIDIGVDYAHIKKVCNYLENNVFKSKLQPFNFLAAWKAINGFTKETYNELNKRIYYGGDFEISNNVIITLINNTLEKCIIGSYKNIKLFEGFGDNNLFACDVSGSMMNDVTPNITSFDIGLIMGMVCHNYSKKSDLGIFGDSFKLKNELVRSDISIFDKFMKFIENEGEVGYATNGWKALDHALKNKKKYNFIMMFTDCQMYDTVDYGQKENKKISSLWKDYKKLYPGSRLILFNLNSYGDSALNVGKDDIYMVSGWNDEMLNCLYNVINSGHALADINQVEL